ncbi:MAG: hypothetical protein PHF51_04275 [Candidatus ainarchaeum sp.]|nr:hypothetical protein [Candidatus ainarchaeum sp.]
MARNKMHAHLEGLAKREEIRNEDVEPVFSALLGFARRWEFDLGVNFRRWRDGEISDGEFWGRAKLLRLGTKSMKDGPRSELMKMIRSATGGGDCPADCPLSFMTLAETANLWGVLVQDTLAGEEKSFRDAVFGRRFSVVYPRCRAAEEPRKYW